MAGYHWYDGDGNPRHELGLKDARQAGLHPSVTTVQKLQAVPFLEVWKVKQAVKRSTEELMNLEFEGVENPLHQFNSAEDVDEWADKINDTLIKNLMEAADWGTGMHDQMEKLLADNDYRFDEPYQNWEECARAWKDENIQEVIALEKVRICNEVGLAGTVDVYCIHNVHGPCVMDYKNRKYKLDKRSGNMKCGFYDKDRDQLAKYSDMIMVEEGLDDLPTIVSVGINAEVPSPFQNRVWSRDGQEKGIKIVNQLATLWRTINNFQLD